MAAPTSSSNLPQRFIGVRVRNSWPRARGLGAAAGAGDQVRHDRIQNNLVFWPHRKCNRSVLIKSERHHRRVLQRLRGTGHCNVDQGCSRRILLRRLRLQSSAAASDQECQWHRHEHHREPYPCATAPQGHAYETENRDRHIGEHPSPPRVPGYCSEFRPTNDQAGRSSVVTR